MTMDPYFLFGRPGNEILAALVAAYAVTACALAFGCVYIHRYYKTRIRRNLGVAMLLIIGAPILAYLSLQLDVALVQKRVGPEMVDHFFFQNSAVGR